MSARSQQSFVSPVVRAIAEGATVPNAGAAGAVAYSSITGGYVRWSGTAWDSVRAAPRAVQAYLDFAHASGGESDTASVTVAAPWVTADSPVICTPAGQVTTDHDPEDAALELLQVYASNRVPGVGFDITAYAPHGTWGRHLITATG